MYLTPQAGRVNTSRFRFTLGFINEGLITERTPAAREDRVKNTRCATDRAAYASGEGGNLQALKEC